MQRPLNDEVIRRLTDKWQPAVRPFREDSRLTPERARQFVACMRGLQADQEAGCDCPPSLSTKGELC
jgi:hypothetical protein